MSRSTPFRFQVPFAYRWRFLVAVLLLVASGWAGPAAAQSFLRASGTKIVNASNQEVILNGVNLGGWALQEGYILKPGWGGINGKQTQGAVKQTLYNAGMSDAAVEAFYQSYRDNFITKPDIDFIASQGFNCIRLPLHYDLFLTPGQRAVRNAVLRGTTTYADYVRALSAWNNANELFVDPANMEAFRMIDRVLEWCAANQLYVVLDLHAAPGSQGTDANIADSLIPLDFWNNPINQDVTNRLWASVARRYKNDARVAMYDLINEPNHVPSNQQIRDVFQRLINTVRAESDNHLLLLEGNGFGNDYNFMEKRNFTNTANLVYNSHRYSGTGYLLDNNVSSSEPNNPNSLRTIGNLTRFRTENDVPIWVGETGENTNGWMQEAGRNLNSVGIGTCHWTYKRFDANNNAALLRINPPYIVDGQSALPQVLTNILFANCVPNNTLAAVSPLQNGLVNYPDGGNYLGTAGAGYTGPAVGRNYEISARHSGKALEVENGSLANGARLQQVAGATAPNQQWELVETGNGYVRIVNRNSRKSLDIDGPSTANGALVHQWQNLLTDSQYWQILGNGDGTYRVINKFSNKALEIRNAALTDGAGVQQSTWASADNQRWGFRDQGAVGTPLATGPARAAAALGAYPNPVAGTLSYPVPAGLRTHRLVVLDTAGRQVLSKTCGPAGELHTLDVAVLKPGLYVVRISSPTYNTEFKISKQ
ncbi:RICIN domain-containing protein [Hymenobacter sp. IS2118]|uniref:RICIN domain-containing protein n=1 Tax=Hymenobacter sp. IS2118 TaxID=1505605 RepID=UPI0009DE50DB|nr:RICIN domain-containing protein [Hymenobacter sp. IS2118]